MFILPHDCVHHGKHTTHDINDMILVLALVQEEREAYQQEAAKVRGFCKCQDHVLLYHDTYRCFSLSQQ